MAVSESDMHAMSTQQMTENSLSDFNAYVQSNASSMEPAPLNFDDAPTLLDILNQSKKQTSATESVSTKIPAAINLEQSALGLASSHLDLHNLPKPSDSIPTFAAQELTEKVNLMLNEMRGMRNRVETQLTAMSWNNQLQNNPVKSKILSTLLAANFSASLARVLTEKLPNQLDAGQAFAWVRNTLSMNLSTIDNESELLDQGGIFALVGPTGVGKTTTTAKLAARYVMKHGTQNLGLITTDGYRIGGHEQLRIYGKILGVMVYAVKDEADLKIALNELKNKHTILVDTVGVSQRDQMVTEQIAMLSNASVNIKKLLCLNATSTGETLTDVIRAYKGRALDGCIVTKLDEAASIGNALDVVIRERIKLYYTTHGQRVPEDIQIANKEDLISRALTLDSSCWPFQYLDEELPLVIANLHADHGHQDTEASNV
jgi:flagellar biosynthesis protein FlhF